MEILKQKQAKVVELPEEIVSDGRPFKLLKALEKPTDEDKQANTSGDSYRVYKMADIENQLTLAQVLEQKGLAKVVETSVYKRLGKIAGKTSELVGLYVDPNVITDRLTALADSLTEYTGLEKRTDSDSKVLGSAAVSNLVDMSQLVPVEVPSDYRQAA